jgi:hypothetical protein
MCFFSGIEQALSWGSSKYQMFGMLLFMLEILFGDFGGETK